MQINKEQVISMKEATENFDRAVEIADKHGAAVIAKNDKPEYLLVPLNEDPAAEPSHEEQVDAVAKRIFEKYRAAFEELAK